MFTTVKDHYTHLIELLSGLQGKDHKILIFSIGLYAGILADGQDTSTWGDYYHLYTRDFLDKCISFNNVNIAICPPEYKSCRGQIPCRHCESSYIKQIVKLYNHKEHFEQFNWKLAKKTHISTIAIGDQCVVGRNLNDSNYNSISYKIMGDAARASLKHLESIYVGFPDLDNDSIIEYIKEQNISERIFNES